MTALAELTAEEYVDLRQPAIGRRCEMWVIFPTENSKERSHENGDESREQMGCP
jgi:hypothetical protein